MEDKLAHGEDAGVVGSDKQGVCRALEVRRVHEHHVSHFVLQPVLSCASEVDSPSD